MEVGSIMKKSLSLVLVLLLAIFFATPAFAIMPDEDMSGYEARTVNKIICLYWDALDVMNQIESVKGDNVDLANKYKKIVRELNDSCNELAANVIYNMDKNNLSSLKKFSDIYKIKQVPERQPLYLACSSIISKVKSDILSNRPEIKGTVFASVEQFAAEYFPGYGYGEPGFKYRKGKELSSEFLNAYWQEEEKTMESAKHFEGTIDIKIAAELKNNPHIGNFKELGEPFKVDVGGHIVLCIKVSFDTMVKIVTRSKKKYAQTKVWFELLRRQSSVFGDASWEVCGKTYEMHDIYTNEEIVSGVTFGRNK